MYKFRVLLMIIVILGVTTSAFASGQQNINVNFNPQMQVIVDGKQITGDVKPFIYNDRVMVPLRFVAEALGAEVRWDESASKVIIEKQGALTTQVKPDEPRMTLVSPVAGAQLIPHTVSSDGKAVIEPNIMARDYASTVLALSWIAKNTPESNKVKSTTELVKVIKDTQDLFINADGSVKVEYEHVGGTYKLKGLPEVRTQAYMAYGLVYPHHAAMEGNYDMSAFAEVHKTTAQTPIRISAFSFNQLADKKNGGFYNNVMKDKKDLADQAFGLYSIQPLVWLYQKHPDRLALAGINERELLDFAIKTDEFMKKLWSEQYGIYADTFKVDGTEGNITSVKYDLRTIGFLLWGHSLLHNIIVDVDPARAANIEYRAKKFFNNVIVDGVTYKPESGIPREIKVTNGLAAVSRDETNTGRLFDFVHAIFQYQRTIKDPRALNMVKEMVLLGADKMHVDGILIHDYTFTNPDNKNTIRELPYLTAYITAAERVINMLSPEEQKIIRKCIQANYDFLIKEAIRR